MRSLRPIPPALIGLLSLYIGINSVAHDLRYYPDTVVAVVRGSLVPIALGAGLLLAALAISRRSRAGYLLGLATAALLILGGLAVIALEVGYISRGDNAAQWAPIFFVGGGSWIAIWALYARSIRRARESFAPTWRPGDRRFAIVLAGLVVFTAAAHIGLGAIERAAAEAGVANRDQAEKLVQGTSLVVDASDVTAESAGATGAPAAVQRMHLDLELSSLATYELAQVPTLCLTDLATARDPHYKPDTYCWGLAGRAVTLDSGFPRLVVEHGTVTFELDVAHAESLCAFGTGRWNAEVRLAPRLAKADGSGNVEAFSVSASFNVQVNGQPLPGDPYQPTTDCIASTVPPLQVN